MWEHFSFLKLLITTKKGVKNRAVQLKKQVVQLVVQLKRLKRSVFGVVRFRTDAEVLKSC